MTVDVTVPGPAGGVRTRQRVVAGLVRAAARVGWAEPEVLRLGRLVGPGDVCIDVGAAYGMYGHVLAELVGPGGAVYAFEPQRASRRVLRTGSVLTGHALSVVPAAVGAARGHADLAVPVRFGVPVRGWAHLDTGSGAAVRRSTVEVRGIDEFCAERGIRQVRFVKVDVEGFELSVLAGARDTLLRDRPALQLEVEERHLSRYGLGPSDVLDHLTALGYRPHIWRDHRWSPVARIDPHHRNHLFLAEG